MMSPKIKCIIVMLCALLGLTSASYAANEITCTRSFSPANYVPGENVTVTLTIDVDESIALNAFGIDEFYPSGWTFVEVIAGPQPGKNLPGDSQLGWLLINLGDPYPDLVKDTIITYTVTPPAGETATKTFTGLVSYIWPSGTNHEYPTSGDTEIDRLYVPPTVGFSSSASSGSEATTAATVDVTLSSSSWRTVTVNYSLSDGTATAGDDYTSNSGTLTFSPSSTSETITIAVIDDSTDEDNETILVTLSNATNANLGTSGHTYTIEDNDDPPTVGFDVASSSGDEDNSPAGLTVSLSAASGLEVKVDYAVTGGTATGSGTDYTLLGTGTLIFAAGDISEDIAITVVDDSTDEDDETIEVTLSNPTNANIGTSGHTYTILEDNADIPVITFSSTGSQGDEAVSPVTMAVNLSQASAKTVTVDYSVSGTATGGGVDYTLADDTLTFSPMETTKNIILTIEDDVLDETNEETVTVTLSSPTNATLGANDIYTYTIIDNDIASIEFDQVSSNGSESVTAVTLDVMLSLASVEEVEVDYSVTGGSADSGGVDYTLLGTGTLTFAAGETSENIAITVVDDLLDELDETIEVTLSTPTNAILGTIIIHTYTIKDNDDPPIIEFVSDSSDGFEDNSPAELTVRILPESGLLTIVQYSITGGSATGGVDYTNVSGSLTFPAGDTDPQTISIPIIDDDLDEDNETVIVTLSNPTNASIGTASHTYTIIDNDDEPSVEFTGSSLLQGEEGAVSQVSMDVELSTVSGRTVTVDYSTSGDADESVDYNIAAGPLTFLPGETTKNISLTIIDDSSGEADETIIVTLSNPTNATTGAVSSYIYTIINDDLPSIEFADVSLSGSEADSSVELTVTLLPGFPQTAQVEYSVTAGSADGGGVDYTLLGTGVLDFSAMETTEKIAITVINDSLYEGDETIIVTLSNPTNATLGTNITHTYTIVDNDEPPIIEFADVSSSGDEGIPEVLMSVKISEVSGALAKVDFSITGGTAIVGQDYTLDSGYLEFWPGETAKDIKITIFDDESDEDNETVIVTLSNATDASIGTKDSYTYTIIDNDDVPSVEFTPTGLLEGKEGAVSQVSMDVELSPASGKIVTVDYTLSGPATGGGDDYTIADGPLTFSPGETTKNIPITIHDDSEVELDEKIYVTLSDPTNATIGTNGIYAYKILDDDGVIEFAEVSSSGFESDSSVELIVTLSQGFLEDVTVKYLVMGGSTATKGVDYTIANETLTFPAGDTVESIKIYITNDDEVEPDETIIVTLSEPSSGTIGINESHTYTILGDDETLPEISGFIPERFADQVARDTIIQLHITDEVIADTSGRTGIALDTVEIKVEGEVIYDGANENPEGIYDSSKGICRRMGTEEDYTFVFQPSTLFDYEQKVEVEVYAEDKAGNVVNETYHFYTVMRSFGPNIQVNSDIGDLVPNNPATARDFDDNILVVFQTNAAGDKDVLIAKLPADGSAFEDSVPVFSGVNNQSNPAIAIDRSNEIIHVVCQGDDPSGKWDIFHSFSTNGTGWSTPVKVNTEDPLPEENNSDQTSPTIAVDKNGKVYVAFVDNSAGDENIVVATSTDDGSTWVIEKEMIYPSAQTEPFITIDELDDTAYIFFTDAKNAVTNGTGTDIYGAKSHSWVPGSLVETVSNQSSPVGVVSNGVIHLLWLDDENNGLPSIFYGNSEAAEPFTGISIVDEPGTEQRAPSIAFNGTKIFACWQDYRNVENNNGDIDIYFAESGSDFGTNILVNDDEGANTQTAPVMGIDKYGNPYMGWVDNRLGDNIFGVATTSVGDILRETTVTASKPSIVQINEGDGVDDEDDVIVEIPAGALPVDTKITISELLNPPSVPPGGFGVPYEFGPSGLEFSEQVTITIPHAEADCPGHSVYTVYWYDPSILPPASPWTQEGISDVEHLTPLDGLPPGVHAVRFKTTHFTGFGIGGFTPTPGSILGGGGGGGGGGCDISSTGQGNVIEYMLPYVLLTIVWVIIKRKDARNRKTIV